MTVRMCSTCKEVKDIEEFHKSKAHKGGYLHKCKTCARAYKKLYYPKVKEANAIRAKQWRLDNPFWGESRRLQTQYGITLEQYNELSNLQGDVCAICGKPETSATGYGADKVRRLAVDHDHITGKIRGLLCGKCNTAIGLFKDRPDWLIKAGGYILHGMRNE